MGHKHTRNEQRIRRWQWGTPLTRVRALLRSWLRIPLKRLGIHLVTLVLAILTLSLLYNFTQQVLQSAELERQRTQLEAEVAALRAEITFMEGNVAYAQSDVYVELIARDQLGFAREGDIVVRPQIAEATPTPEPEEPPETIPEPVVEPNWQRWLEAFQAPGDYKH